MICNARKERTFNTLNIVHYGLGRGEAKELRILLLDSVILYRQLSDLLVLEQHCSVDFVLRGLTQAKFPIPHLLCYADPPEEVQTDMTTPLINELGIAVVAGISCEGCPSFTPRASQAHLSSRRPIHLFGKGASRAAEFSANSHAIVSKTTRER